MNFTNPTKYSASVPYFHVNILNNKTLLGYAVAKDVVITPGRNEDILIKALWDPSGLGGHNGTAVGRELLSQYISGTFPSCRIAHLTIHRLEHNADAQGSRGHHTITTNAWKSPVLFRH